MLEGWFCCGFQSLGMGSRVESGRGMEGEWK